MNAETNRRSGGSSPPLPPPHPDLHPRDDADRHVPLGGRGRVLLQAAHPQAPVPHWLGLPVVPWPNPLPLGLASPSLLPASIRRQTPGRPTKA